VAQKFYMERLNLKKSNDVTVKEGYHVKISNRTAALENLGGGGEMTMRTSEGFDKY
jgi:hypothetical protein